MDRDALMKFVGTGMIVLPVILAVGTASLDAVAMSLFALLILQLAVLVIRPDDPIGDKMRADAEKDDNTIRRCIGFAKAEYYGGIEVVNLFAWRATKPADLWKAADPVGPDNDSHLRAVVGTARMIVCAWGSNAARQPERAKHVRDLLHYYMPLHYLQLTKDGIPCHPLMLPKSCEPMLWEFEF